MRIWMSCLALICLLACGCKTKSTDDLIGNLKSGTSGERIAAVRLLPQHGEDAEKVVPALIESLKDKKADVRWSAAIGLGYFGAQAKDAVPALQLAVRDPDARVREGARVALSRIDPNQFPLGSNRDPYKKKK